jgi:hypothetical protein
MHTSEHQKAAHFKRFVFNTLNPTATPNHAAFVMAEVISKLHLCSKLKQQHDLEVFEHASI